MRVLFATGHAYPPERVGGAEIDTDARARHLQGWGIDVAVLAGRPRGRADAPLMTDETPGYPVFRAGDPAAHAAAVADRVRPDVAVVQAGRPLPLAGALHAAGVPVLVHLHDVAFDKLGGDPRAAPVAGFLANSRFTQRRFRDAFGLAAAVVPNLIEPDAYRVEALGEAVTFVNPVPAKGLDTALAVAARIRNASFLFVEGWPMRGRRRIAARLRAWRRGNVTWWRQTADMRRVFARTRVLIAPSRVPETFGRVAAEAQVSGIPVVASEVGGLPEAVGDGGVLLPPDDTDAWAATVDDLVRNADRWAAVSAAARRTAAVRTARIGAEMERYLGLLRHAAGLDAAPGTAEAG